MSMKNRRKESQGNFWLPTQDIPKSKGHPFYIWVNKVLSENGFDEYVEDLCRPYYAKGGRPSIPPGNYFRMLMIGYFERIDSERGIEWRCADSLSLREFLGLEFSQTVPDHSSLSRIRNRLPLEVHQEILTWVLGLLAENGLVKGKTIGLDATSLEANAAMRSIVRKDTGEGYEEFLRSLAKESGIETPTREELATIDKSRKNKASNDDWQSPSDPDSGITKMKDGRTHLAHKAEHAVDLDTEAIVAVTLQPGHTGDTTSGPRTTELAESTVSRLHEQGHEDVNEHVEESVTDKGYHSNEVLQELDSLEIRTYISEPDRGRRNWKGREKQQRLTYNNRRRIRGERGRHLQRLRAEYVERGMEHCYGHGGMRRCWLRGTENILKRLLVHVSGYNISLFARKLFGFGTPKAMADGVLSSIIYLFGIFMAVVRSMSSKFYIYRSRGLSIEPKADIYAGAA